MNPGIDERLVDLETRLAFQERALAEMSDAVAAARMEQLSTQHLLQQALTDLRQLRTMLYADPATEPTPPHY